MDEEPKAFEHTVTLNQTQGSRHHPGGVLPRVRVVLGMAARYSQVPLSPRQHAREPNAGIPGGVLSSPAFT